jgi:hypothetical protein
VCGHQVGVPVVRAERDLFQHGRLAAGSHEQVDPFRGTDNDGLPENHDGVFTLGGVTLDASSSSHPALARDGYLDNGRAQEGSPSR